MSAMKRTVILIVILMALLSSISGGIHKYPNVDLQFTSIENDPLKLLESNLTQLIKQNSTESRNKAFSMMREYLYDYYDHHPEILMRQAGLPAIFGNFNGCGCTNGRCGCCTGDMLIAFRSKGCVNITYYPEDFLFKFKMTMNDRVLYQNNLSGKNPRPFCVNPPRFQIIEVCAKFHDLYFIGRNMHVCLDMSANFQGFEIFDRSFNCLRMGDKGVKLLRPEEGGGVVNAGAESIIDSGEDDIPAYDEIVS